MRQISNSEYWELKRKASYNFSQQRIKYREDELEALRIQSKSNIEKAFYYQKEYHKIIEKNLEYRSLLLEISNIVSTIKMFNRKVHINLIKEKIQNILK